MGNKSITIESTQTKGNASIFAFGVQGKITIVNSRRALKTHYIAPESVSLLFDENEPTLWLIQSDKSGYKIVRAYDLTVHYDKAAMM